MYYCYTSLWRVELPGERIFFLNVLAGQLLIKRRRCVIIRANLRCLFLFFGPGTLTANPAFFCLVWISSNWCLLYPGSLIFLFSFLFNFKQKVVITCLIGYLCFSLCLWERVFLSVCECVDESMWLGSVPEFMQYVYEKHLFCPNCLCMCEQGNNTRFGKMCVRTLFVCKVLDACRCIWAWMRVRAR